MIMHVCVILDGNDLSSFLKRNNNYIRFVKHPYIACKLWACTKNI